MFRKRFEIIVSSCIISLFLLTGFANASVGTDSELFKKGFSAFQKNNFRGAIQNLNKLLDAYPSSPIRDMALYYLARSQVKAGNRSEAARLTVRLMREFPATYSSKTIDAELLKTVAETTAASAVASGKNHPPAAPAPPEKKDAQHRKNGLKVQKQMQDEPRVPPAGTEITDMGIAVSDVGLNRNSGSGPAKGTAGGVLPFETSVAAEHKGEAGKNLEISFAVTNRGAALDRYFIETRFPSRWAPRFDALGILGGSFQTPTIGHEITYSGKLTVSVPADGIDGSSFRYPLKIYSLEHKQSFSTDIHVEISAPFLRGILSAKRGQSEKGHTVAYSIAILNAGSGKSEDLSLKLICPLSYQLIESKPPDFGYAGEALEFHGLRLGPGEMKELQVSFEVPRHERQDEDCRAELIDNTLNMKHSFSPRNAIGK